VEDRFLLVIADLITGLLPWLAWGLLPYVLDPVRSAAAALTLALALVGIAWWRGERAKSLEISDSVTFGVILVISLAAGPSVVDWVEDHCDLTANVALTVLALASLLLRRPFTAPYTSARFPDLDPALQGRLDLVSTAMWALGLGVAAVVAWYGEFVLGEPNDFWTGWTLQLAPVFLAYHATPWFDRRTIARTTGAVPQPSDWTVLRDVAMWLAPVGVLAVMVNDAPLWVGEALFWSGLVGTAVAVAMVRRRAAYLAA
jgi:hypothetical protein